MIRSADAFKPDPHTHLVYDGDYGEEAPTFAGELVLHFEREDLMILSFDHSDCDQGPQLATENFGRDFRRANASGGRGCIGCLSKST